MRAWSLGIAVLAVALAVPAGQGHEPPTWAKDVAPLVHERCSLCHTQSGHAPFALETYSDVRMRWELVRQEVLNRRMPPAHFASDFGQFALVKPLTDAQIVMFQEWLRAGMPEGDDSPKAPTQPPKYRLGKPDAIVVTPAIDIPSEGNPVWRAIVFEPPKTEGPLRLRGFDAVPRSPKAVRHVLLAVAAKGAKSGPTQGTLDERADRLIGAWAPGYPAFQLPADVALTLRPGERLIAQVLYQTTGKQEPSEIEFGLYWAKPDAKEARWATREAKEFTIRAFDSLTLTTTLNVQRPTDLLAIVPEARFFAYVVEVLARKDGDKTLLRTIQWDPYWNGSFVFKDPVRLEPGTQIVSNTVYENELHSPINEGKRPRIVYSGPALDQEVCRTHYLLVDR
jgi:hypothetical protein